MVTHEQAAKLAKGSLSKSRSYKSPSISEEDNYWESEDEASYEDPFKPLTPPEKGQVKVKEEEKEECSD